METIFDHGATMKELDALHGPGDFDSSEEYFEFLEDDQQAALADVVWLARMRGDMTLLQQTLKRIEDPEFRRDLSLIPCLDAGHRLGLEQPLRESPQAA